MAAVLLVGSYSYSYSNGLEYGTTNNAAGNGLTWDMKDVFPVPGGLMVNGMIYRYTIEKEREDPAKVHIQNENALDGGYIVKQTDDWTNLPGSTINKVIGLPDIPMEYFGDGSIEVEGKGEIKDPTVIYSYKVDPCFIPLSDPSCPGYLQALYDWLKDNGKLAEDATIEDPYLNEIVQAMLNRETDLEEEEESDIEKENEENEEEIEKLNAGASIEALGDPAAQNAVMQALSTIPNFENYYAATIQGGVYEETLTLEDKEIEDNVQALRNLSQDTLHRSLVRSQYD